MRGSTCIGTALCSLTGQGTVPVLHEGINFYDAFERVVNPYSGIKILPDPESDLKCTFLVRYLITIYSYS